MRTSSVNRDSSSGGCAKSFNKLTSNPSHTYFSLVQSGSLTWNYVTNMPENIFFYDTTNTNVNTCMHIDTQHKHNTLWCTHLFMAVYK